MSKLNSTAFQYELTKVDKKTIKIRAYNFTDQFTGNYLFVTTTEAFYDSYGFAYP